MGQRKLCVVLFPLLLLSLLITVVVEAVVVLLILARQKRMSYTEGPDGVLRVLREMQG